MSKLGGGVSTYFGDLRPAGTKIKSGGQASSVVNWVREFDLTAKVVTQGNVRRGSIATYIPIDHPDLPDILKAKDHTDGDPRQFIDCNIAVTIKDSWVEEMLAGDQEKIDIFAEVLEMRVKTGSPYITFIDTVNKNTPDGKLVSLSNLCNEITLYTDPQHSAVCCLSSMNLAKWDEWKDWKGFSGFTAVEIAVFLLDAVMEDFITKASDKQGMEPAVRFAQKARALGLGTMGLHCLYQKKGYAWDAQEARDLNIEIHKTIQEQAINASHLLAIFLGCSEWAEPLERRNTHLIAIAPTRTNSVISGAFSQGVEPLESNFYVSKEAKGTYVRKNPVLDEYLQANYSEDEQTAIWESILENGGSIQHLDIPNKEVFKTSREIDQFTIIDQASDRQKFICQSQSINLFVDTDVTTEYLWKLHLYAWIKQLKGLYYLKGKSKAVKKAQQGYLMITKPDCPYCVALKTKLNEQGIKFTEVGIEGAKLNGLWKPEYKTVPQLFINGERIGGYDNYCAACEG